MLRQSNPECLDGISRKNKKRPDASLIYESIYKELKNPDSSIKTIEKRLSPLSSNNKINKNKTKFINGKNSNFVKAPVLPSARDESLPFLVNCQTPTVKIKGKLVQDKINILYFNNSFYLQVRTISIVCTIPCQRLFVHHYP